MRSPDVRSPEGVEDGDSSIAELTPQQFNARYPLVGEAEVRARGCPVSLRRGVDVVRGGHSLRRRSQPVPSRYSPSGELVNDSGNADHASSVVESTRKPRSGGGRRRVARAKVEGPSVAFGNSALKTLLLRMMRDVADAAGLSRSLKMSSFFVRQAC